MDLKTMASRIIAPRLARFSMAVGGLMMSISGFLAGFCPSLAYVTFYPSGSIVRIDGSWVHLSPYVNPLPPWLLGFRVYHSTPGFLMLGVGGLLILASLNMKGKMADILALVGILLGLVGIPFSLPEPALSIPESPFTFVPWVGADLAWLGVPISYISKMYEFPTVPRWQKWAPPTMALTFFYPPMLIPFGFCQFLYWLASYPIASWKMKAIMITGIFPLIVFALVGFLGFVLSILRISVRILDIVRPVKPSDRGFDPFEWLGEKFKRQYQ